MTKQPILLSSIIGILVLGSFVTVTKD